MRKVILASSSSRRKDILSKYKIDLEIYPSFINEKVRGNFSPEETVMSLSFEKAKSVEKYFKNHEIIIGADTVVYIDNMILGKPKDEQDAFNMIKLLSGREHNVVTGISIIEADSNIKIIDYEKTKVVFRKLSDDKIKNYIETNEYEDKAGGYGIQGYGEILVERIEGCYSNVVGMPVFKLDYLLEKYFNISLL
ncbi:nucleoside triphosphate pyrophosphatase [Sporanaerobacter sp. PP17-6a]|jgi:septum formation protein|uniref:nucleoside triphosphate pyrophosphatase n=1 Tax=Sporanaerobacter sp. PP17-6a TaxID=1891289 RepID=UPI00089FD2AE|nr:Maf family protein [Sporanaerobacter sp. PP17-6a]SCL84095.1 Septum formation protein Maf [Sporanaerobacter sp. PP17-6a]